MENFKQNRDLYFYFFKNNGNFEKTDELISNIIKIVNPCLSANKQLMKNL